MILLTFSYPKEARRGKNVFLRPELLSRKELRNYTSLEPADFWQIVDDLSVTRLMDLIDLSLPATVLLFRIRGRLDYSFLFLSTLFEINENRVSELYQMTLVTFHSIRNELLRFYTTNPTEAAIDRHIVKINSGAGEFEDEMR